jgi:hypothetical protein
MNIQKFFLSQNLGTSVGTKLDMLGGPYERKDVAPRFVCMYRDRCNDFLKYFRKKLAKKLTFLTQNKAKL